MLSTPANAPHFFVDRSLGRRQVPSLLRDAGFDLSTLAEVFGVPEDERVADVEWLALAGSKRWPVLMKDDRIRYRAAEREALTAHRVVAFCLAGGNLRATDMAQLFMQATDAILAVCSLPGPSLHVVSRSGLRPVELQ